MYRDKNNRKVIQFFEDGKEGLGSFADQDQLININMFYILLYVVQNGYKVTVNDQLEADKES